MRRAITPAIPPSMYRHFAVLTVVLTASLAMFAEGENREARAAPTVQAAKPAAPVALVPASSTDTSRQAESWFDADSFSDYGVGGSSDGLFGSENSSVIPDLEGLAPGYSPEYLASLSEEERELLLSGLQESGMLEPDIRSRRSAALSAASSRRSGSSTVDD